MPGTLHSSAVSIATNAFLAWMRASTLHRGAAMFEDSLVESTTILRSQNRWPVVISTAFYTAIALALISLPVLHPDVLSTVVHPLLTFTPPRPYTPPPTPPPVHVLPTVATNSSTPAPMAPIFNTHTFPTSTPAEAPNFNPTTIVMGPAGNTSIIGQSAPSSTANVTRAPGGTGTGGDGTATHGPLNISRGVSAGLLLAPIQPIYPPIAKAAHQQGIVIVQAIISRTGQIESAHIVSGPAMLQGSALDAVRSARYRPYLLNGQPTEVDTTFSINFLLGSSY
jgi:protein TonB